MATNIFRNISSSIKSSQAVRNAGWLLVEKGLLLGSSFLFAIVLTRYWSVSQLGEYQYILALLALLAPFSNLGLNSLISKELVNRPEHTAEIMGTAIVMRLGGALIGGLIFSVLSFWLIPPSLQPLFFILLCAQITHALGAIDYYFEAKVQSKVSATLRTVIGLVFVLLKFIFVINGAGLTTVLVITVVEWTLLACLWLLVYQIFHRGLLHLTWNTNQARFYLRRCGWLILSSIAAVVYLKIDQVMLGMMVSIEEVAFYSLASRLSEVWYLVPGIVVASFYPALIKLKSSGGNGAYSAMLQRMCDYLCWGAIIIAILVSLAAPVFVPFIFGLDYQSVTAILQVHIWAGVFIFMRAIFSKWLLIEDIPKYSLVTHGCGAVINLMLNMLLIPHWGALGAAWSTLISYAMASYLGLFLFPKTRAMGVLMSRSLLFPVRKFIY